MQVNERTHPWRGCQWDGWKWKHRRKQKLRKDDDNATWFAMSKQNLVDFSFNICDMSELFLIYSATVIRSWQVWL